MTHEVETLDFDSMTPISKGTAESATSSYSPKFNKSHYSRNNSALIVHLHYQPNPSTLPVVFVIANTHLYWNPSSEEIKLMQISHVLARLSQIKRGECLSPTLPAAPSDCGRPKNLVVCGDLNSMPESNVVKFITRLEEPDSSKVE